MNRARALLALLFVQISGGIRSQLDRLVRSEPRGDSDCEETEVAYAPPHRINEPPYRALRQ